MQPHDPADQPRPDPSQRLLETWMVYAIFVFWTLFAVFVYSRYSQLGDARSYLTGAYDEESQARTLLVTRLATAVISLVRVDVLAHLAFSLFCASGVAYMVRSALVHGRYRWPVLALLLAPGFGVWSSVVGRESLYIGMLGFFLGAMVGHFRGGGGLRLLLALVALGGMVFLRAPFGLAMAVFFVMSLLVMHGPRTGLSAGVQTVVLALLGLVALVLAWPAMDAYIQGEVLPKAQSYFTINSSTTRTWIHIGSSGQLFRDLWWMLPLAMVGPTPAEAVARPAVLPFLLSGLVIFGLLLYALWQALTMPRGLPRKVVLVAWLPALAMTLVAYVPFGVYNPGSGIRYASCFLLLLLLPTLMRSALSAEAVLQAARAAAPAGGYGHPHARFAEIR